MSEQPELINGNDPMSHLPNLPLPIVPLMSANEGEVLQLSQEFSNELYFAAVTTLPNSMPHSMPPIATTNAAGFETEGLLEEVMTTDGLPAASESLDLFVPNQLSTAGLESAHAAAAIASAEEANEVSQHQRHLIFSLGDVRYAVPMDHILEIAELENYTPVPNLPDWILGITNLRGDIISLIDLNALQGEPRDEIARGSNLLVVQTKAGDLTTCLVVDRVQGVTSVNPKHIQRLDRMMNNSLSVFTGGYVNEDGEAMSLIDLEKLLRSLELTR